MTVLVKTAGPSGSHHLTANGAGLVTYILTGSVSLFFLHSMSKDYIAKAVQHSIALSPLAVSQSVGVDPEVFRKFKCFPTKLYIMVMA